MSTPDPSVAPAGWYRDPLGIPQLRWWNGTAWTNHIQEPRIEFQTWEPEPAEQQRTQFFSSIA